MFLFLLSLAHAEPPTLPPGPDLSGVYPGRVGTLSLAGGRNHLWLSYEGSFGAGQLCSGLARLDHWGNATYKSPDGAVALHVEGGRIVLDAVGGFCGIGWPGDAFELAQGSHPTCAFKNPTAERYVLQDTELKPAGKGAVSKYGKLDAFLVEREGPLVPDPTSAMGFRSGQTLRYWVLAESGWAAGIYGEGDLACR